MFSKNSFSCFILTLAASLPLAADLGTGRGACWQAEEEERGDYGHYLLNLHVASFVFWLNSGDLSKINKSWLQLHGIANTEIVIPAARGLLISDLL